MCQRQPELQACRTDAPDACEAAQPDATRRALLAGTAAAPLAQFAGCGAASAAAAAAPTLEDVTPAIAKASPLRQGEQAIIDVFEQNTRSVANVFDLSLQSRTNPMQIADIPEGNGSGFVWSEDGYIVTNYHVLANIMKGLGPNASTKGTSQGVQVARVTLLDAEGVKRDFIATLAGHAKSKDLLVLRINAPRDLLKPVTLGSSTGLRVGQQCLAIGNPFGFDHTLTTGAVSGLNRVIQSQTGGVIAGGVQTDAAINPGNSGGPLLDSSGTVIGVNTAIFTNTGTSAGVGFALPIDTVRAIVPQLIANGKVATPTLGLTFATDAVARSLKVAPGEGAVVQSLDPKGPAALAGLLGTRRGLTGIIAGDAIVAVGSKQVKYAQDVGVALEDLRVGQVVRVKFKRGADSAPKQMEADLSLAAGEP